MEKAPTSAHTAASGRHSGPVAIRRATVTESLRVLVSIGDVRLFADVSGPMLVPDGPKMRDQPVIVMVHGGSLIGPVVVTYRPPSRVSFR